MPRKDLSPKTAIRILETPGIWHTIPTYDLIRAANYALALVQAAHAELQSRAERRTL